MSDSTSHPETSAPQEPAPVSTSRSAELRKIRNGFIVGLVVTAALIGGKYLVEKTSAVAFVEESLYQWLQFKLQPVGSEQDIVVVDIRNLALDGSRTSRPQLQQLLDRLLEDPEHRPRAIGIDVDFSPLHEGVPLTEQDPVFLNYCLDHRYLVNNKLFVGIDSSLKFGPDRWLVSPKFSPLGAYVGRVVPEKQAITSTNPRVDQQVELPYMNDQGEKESASILSLSAAVAGVPAPISRPLRWVLNRVEDVHDDGISYQQFWVDFSPINYIRDHSVIVSVTDGKPTTGSLSQLAGKFVLLGRGLGATEDQGVPAADIFHVPGHAEDYAGVFLHASALYSLFNPVYHLTELGRAVMDTVFSVAGFGFIALVQLFYLDRPEKVKVERLKMFAPWIAVAAVFFVGELMLNTTRLLWDDYLLVMVALLAHSWIERHEEWAGEFPAWLHARWRGLALEKTPKP